MTPESKLYSFLDNKNSFTVHFMEGQRVIEEMAILHHLKGAGFSYYRDLLLSTLPLVSLLKRGESFGFYLDSEDPFFRFKLETNYTGNLRTLMLPEDFGQFPEKITGIVRFSKLFESGTPYTTLLKVENQSFADVVNQLLKDSYQIDSQVSLSDIVDQGLLISKIPRENVGRYIIDPGMTLETYCKQFRADYAEIFAENFVDEKNIVEFFTKKGLYFLGTKSFQFYCPCNKERMATNLSVLSDHDIDEVFDKKEHIEIICDYCHKAYNLSKQDIRPN